MNTIEIKISKQGAEKRAKRILEIIEVSLMQEKDKLVLSEDTKAELLDRFTNHLMQFNFAIEEL
jgi:hypothetical protein